MDWLRMIRDHEVFISSFHRDRDELDMSPFDGKGGMNVSVIWRPHG